MTSRAMACIVLGTVLATAAGGLDSAAAQSYVGCFVNGQQVPDSMCQGGGAGGGSPSFMSNPFFGTWSQGNYALGGALEKALQNAFSPSAPSPSDIARQRAAEAERAAQQRAAEQAAQQRAALKAAQDREWLQQEASEREAADEEQRAFWRRRNSLVSRIHRLDGTPADAGGLKAASAPGLDPQQMHANAPVDADKPTPTVLRILNQTASYVTVSVDGAYGCNTAGGTTCTIPVSQGHHNLRAVQEDNGTSSTRSIDIPADGYTWLLSGS